ncbi:MAG: hypothetical protein U5L09_20445 [Bacteroidales bacterium]|nr:hypothetical protein [Bacteroidales bacterium]
MEMSGYTWSELYDWLEKALQANNIDTGNLKPTLHYQIPNHSLYETSFFDKPDNEAAKQVASLRSNIREILKEIVADYPKASHIRIWPTPFRHRHLYTGKQQEGSHDRQYRTGTGCSR